MLFRSMKLRSTSSSPVPLQPYVSITFNIFPKIPVLYLNLVFSIDTNEFFQKFGLSVRDVFILMHPKSRFVFTLILCVYLPLISVDLEGQHIGVLTKKFEAFTLSLFFFYDVNDRFAMFVRALKRTSTRFLSRMASQPWILVLNPDHQ